MLPELVESADISTAFKILRLHINEPFKPSSHFRHNSICAHAGNKLTKNTGTTGSLVAHLRKDKSNLFWATATAAPCTSVFKPIWLEGDVLPDLGSAPKGQFNSKSYWWYHERLHRAFLKDFSIMSQFQPERDLLQASFIKVAYRLKSKERYTYTCDAFKKSRELTKKWWNHYLENKPESKNGILYRKYWERQNEKADFHI